MDAQQGRAPAPQRPDVRSDGQGADDRPSPWRKVIDEISQEVGGRRDEIATIGSINWLRHAMEGQGANPNVVRNIIYRDKGRLNDKRALYVVLQRLRAELGLSSIGDPALTYLGSEYAAAELEVAQVLGREQRRAYRLMVGGIRSGSFPRLLVVGRPGSGKTMLADYIQRALQQDRQQDSASPLVVRFDFSETDLSSSFVRLASELGIEAGVIESRIVRIGTASAFAVQADAQADVVRALFEHLRNRPSPRALLLHLSHGLNRQGTLGAAPLRLNTPDVPRVTASEWLWATLIRQFGALPQTAIYLSTAAAHGAVLESAGATGWLEGPLRLTAPTAAEARRFVQAHAADLDENAKARLVAVAGRSYEALRTLSLLAMLRRAPVDATTDDDGALETLTSLVEPGCDAELRRFLTAVAVLSSADSAGFKEDDLRTIAATGKRDLTVVEQAFLDPVPGRPGSFRSFSRRFVRALNRRLKRCDPEGLRLAHARAASAIRAEALAAPSAESATRFLNHSLEARDWDALVAWLAGNPVSYAELDKTWNVARVELNDAERFEDLALEVARQFGRLGASEHVEAVRAFELLAQSERPRIRAWTAVLRAQHEIAAGRAERAAVLLEVSPPTDDPLLEAERALAAAGVQRWRGELQAAARLVATAADVNRTPGVAVSQAASALAAKTAVWAGVIAKDRGDLEEAIKALWTTSLHDDLVEGRLSFQRGDVALQLGLFELAGRELDAALLSAERSGALPQERARFLARRASLTRQTGDVHGAENAFASAMLMLEASDLDPLDKTFARAKLDDEASYAALARGDFESAILATTSAIANYREYQRRRDVDTTFRVTRAALRLAIAYAFRGLAKPYRRPLTPSLALAVRTGSQNPVNADIVHAFESLTSTLEVLGRPASGLLSGTSAVRGLLREARLVASFIATDAGHASELADSAAADARFDYQRTEAQAGRADALLRLGCHELALEALETARSSFDEARTLVSRVLGNDHVGAPESGDRGLLAQLETYRSAAQLSVGDSLGAAETLCLALSDPLLDSFHEGMLRAFGEVVEALDLTGSTAAKSAASGWRKHRGLRSVLGINGTGPTTPARLPDALVAAWRSRKGPRERRNRA